MTIELNVSTQYESETVAAKEALASIGETVLWQGAIEFLTKRHELYDRSAKECSMKSGLDGALDTATFLRLSEEAKALKSFLLDAMGETIKEREAYIKDLFEDQKPNGTKTQGAQEKSVGGNRFPVSVNSHILNSRTRAANARREQRSVSGVPSEGNEEDS